MSGFLQRLGARAIGRLSIAPRAQSLFEPPSAAPPEPTARLLASMPSNPGHDPGEDQQQAQANPTPRAPATQVREAVSQNATAASKPQQFTLTEQPHLERAVLTEHARPPEAREQLTARPRETTEEQSAVMQPPRPAQPGRPGARQPSSVTALVATRPLPVAVPRAGSVSRPGASVTQAELQSAEPVRVTIGRVEVRAVLAPRPQRAATRTAPPSLPLEDYLRSRGRA